MNSSGGNVAFRNCALEGLHANRVRVSFAGGIARKMEQFQNERNVYKNKKNPEGVS